MGKFWNFKNSAAGNPQLFVYGEINDWWGVDAKSFADELKNITSEEIDVRINSDGGSVFTAQAIYSSLKRHSSKVNVFIDGMAASAATIIAMAGDTIHMPENAMMMVHNPLMFTYGNADDLRENADLLDKVRETLLAVYRNKTGLEDEKIIELLDNETYLTAQEAKDYGFIDVIEKPLEIAASRKDGKVNFNGVAFDANRHAEFFNDLAKEPEAEPVQEPETSPVIEPEQNTVIEPENKEPMMDLKTLQEKHPELYAQIKAQGVDEGAQAEQARINAIDDLGITGHDELVTNAKADKNMTAEKLAVAVIKAEKELGQKKLADRQADADILNGVNPSQAATDTEKQKAKDDAEINAIAAGMKAQRKG